MAAEAADAADDAPRALMMAAPRCCTVGMKASSYHLRSTSECAGLPSTRQKLMSGYWVEEWLPQISILRIFVTWPPVFSASWDTARLWSSRVIAVKLRGFRSLALARAIMALVFAGLP